MYLGVDYYPEHWDQNLMDEDLKRIVEMNANIVRIGEFAWHLMEPVEGEFDFTFFDQFIEKAKSYGLKIMFGTPTATFPAWLAKKDPSILSQDEDGTTRVFGGRRQYCFNSDVYINYAQKITEEVVKHYADEEAIIAWQVDNEFGHEGSHMCYCETCHAGFQEFLSDKYKTVDAMNDTFGTIFWGQTYNEFTEVPLPKRTITTHNPTLRMEWVNFRNTSINRFAKIMIDTIKANAGVNQPVTHNFYPGFFDLAYNQNQMSEELDFVSYDNYPVWGGLREPVEPAEISLVHDYIRGLKNKNYWVVEQIMGAQGHDVIGYLPRPKQAQMWAYQAMAHGCENMMFFRYRGMTRGQEQFCFGVIDHNNQIGRKYLEVQEFFAHVQKHEAAITSPIKNRVAFLYDFNNIWSWKFQPQSKLFDFMNEMKRLYRPFFNNNVGVDVISTAKSIEAYDVVVVPVMMAFSEELKHKLETFAQEGKTVVFTYRTGVKDLDNNVIFGEQLPTHARNMVGAVVAEHEPLQEGDDCRIVGLNGEIGEISAWRDFLKVETAEVLYTYDDPFYGEYAAITKNNFQGANVYYVGGGVDKKTAQTVVNEIMSEAGIQSIESPKGVEVILRGENTFLINHTADAQEVLGHALEAYQVKII